MSRLRTDNEANIRKVWRYWCCDHCPNRRNQAGNLRCVESMSNVQSSVFGPTGDLTFLTNLRLQLAAVNSLEKLVEDNFLPSNKERNGSDRRY